MNNHNIHDHRTFFVWKDTLFSTWAKKDSKQNGGKRDSKKRNSRKRDQRGGSATIFGSDIPPNLAQVANNSIGGVVDNDNPEKNRQNLYEEFNKLKERNLSPAEAMNLATQAAEARFGKGHRVDVSQLLNVVRDEDKGDDVWTVFNRIQENLTQPHRITDHMGNIMNGVSDINEDTRINKELFELVHAYA